MSALREIRNARLASAPGCPITVITNAGCWTCRGRVGEFTFAFGPGVFVAATPTARPRKTLHDLVEIALVSEGVRVTAGPAGRSQDRSAYRRRSGHQLPRNWSGQGRQNRLRSTPGEQEIGDLPSLPCAGFGAPDQPPVHRVNLGFGEAASFALPAFWRLLKGRQMQLQGFQQNRGLGHVVVFGDAA